MAWRIISGFFGNFKALKKTDDFTGYCHQATYMEECQKFQHKENNVFNYKIIISILPATLITVLLSGCAASAIMVSAPMPPIQLDQVQIYTSRPNMTCTDIAFIDSSSQNSFAVTDQGKLEVALNKAKEKAAEIGANSIIIGSADTTGGTASIGVGSGGAGGVFFAPKHKSINVVASYCK